MSASTSRSLDSDWRLIRYQELSHEVEIPQ
jgi:hypothetical protein